MTLIVALLVVFAVVFVLGRAANGITQQRAHVGDLYLRLDSACRERTEAVTGLLKAIKDELKGKDELYDETLAALKGTLQALPPAEQAARERTLTSCLKRLDEKVTEHPVLQQNLKLAKHLKRLADLEREIDSVHLDYNKAAADFNAAIVGGFQRLLARFTKTAPAAKFPYRPEPRGAREGFQEEPKLQG